MVINDDINSLELKKINLEVELNSLIKSGEKDENKINELRSEILYIKKQISKKIGPKEVEFQEKIKRKRLGIKEKNIKNYNAFKSKYKKISKIEIATKNILKSIDNYLDREVYEYSDNEVKVMIR